MSWAAVVLAGGGIDDALKQHAQVASKALIPIGGQPMVARMVDVLRQCRSISAISLVMPEDEVPAEVRARVTHVARPGRKMLDSVAAGLNVLPTEVANAGCLVVPGDCPFMSIEAVEDFLAEVRARPAEFCYGYLHREDSEATYPTLKHTYARFVEGVLCGSGLIIMTPEGVEKARAVMEATIAARKSPLRITGILGWSFILKFIFRRLSVRDAEQRVGELLNSRVSAIRTRHACAGFNVDSLEQLLLAESLVAPSAADAGRQP
ncbi:MAG TPA: nucleotidyltransferase family protein [Candidatus Xenobia bacterium]|jgi:molybdopterin-guanine dinucleotide biosynthesis protein A